MPNVARRHHYIPRFYLKGFSVARKKSRKVVVFDRTTGRSVEAGTENVAVEKDFNRIEVEGHPPDAFEKGMAEFEGLAAPALERIIAAKSLQHEDDRAYLFNVLGLLAIRNPRWRQNWRDFEDRMARTIIDIATATPEMWASQMRQAQAAGYIKQDADIDYEKMKKFVTEGQYDIEVPTERHIIHEMEGLDAILPYIFKRKWALLKCGDDSGGFVTSDHPVCLMWSDPKMRGPLGYGLSGTELVFPICNRLAMIGAFEIEDSEMEASEKLIAAINGTLIQFAERHVYARDYNFPYSLARDDPPRKASKLAGEPRFRKAD